MGADSSGHSGGGGTDRRQVLKLAGAAALAGLAGCSTTQQRTAGPVALDGEGPSSAYALEEATKPTRSFSPDAIDVELAVVSHAASYRRSGDSFLSDVGVGLLATPPAREAGQTFNPLAARSLADLLTSDIGQPLVAKLGVESGWATSPSKLGERSGTLLGMQTTIETFVGHTNDGDVALVNLTRVEHNGDAVLVGDGRSRPLAEGEQSQAASDLVSANERREAAQSLADLLPHVVRERPEATGETTATTSPTPTPKPEHPPARIPVGEVPDALRRRAARFVDRAEGDEATWPDGAKLGQFAHRVTRPDVDGVAYYEIEVEPAGFVLVATDEHDAPVPHWNSDSRPMGRVLEERAEGGPLAWLVWIDRLRYVGEDPEGNRIATRGRDVPRIENVEALTDVSDAVTSLRYGPEEEISDDDQVSEDYEGTQLVAENRQEPPAISFAQWESHDQLKENYESAYGPLLTDLRERAERAWSTYRELGGTSRKVGTHRTVREPLLTGQLVGEIAETSRDAFHVERVTRDVAHDVLEIVPTDAASEGDAVTLALENAAGVRETIEYQAVAPVDDPTEPMELDVVDDVAQALDDRPPSANRSWAGGAGLQPWFYQYDYQGCPVGCGPVAWAILFAWCDRQAAGGKFHSTWSPRWGLYRRGGGYGADAVAPKNHDSSPQVNSNGIKNVIEELNHHVDVFCLGDNGATAPWDMDEARYYLWGRTGTDLEVHYHAGGFPKPRCKRETAESIRGQANGKEATPVVVGKGWLSHYPVAYAYRNDWIDDVKVNNGWGPTHDERTEWIWASSWFSGETYP